MSRRLPALKPKDILRLLEREGFFVPPHQRQSLRIEAPAQEALRVTLPWHGRDLKRGTLGSIIRQAGYTDSEFLGLL
jgi:predicted RNA binding protein YcfA (HicA-like mRNA interferase family)